MTDDELRITPAGFAELTLGLPLYKWQADAVATIPKAIGPAGRRQNIAVVAPNGSGKDDRIIPTAAYWWLFHNPKGRVVITSKSDLQLSQQTIPNLEKHYRKFGWAAPVQSPRYCLTTTTGGSLVAYVTNEGARSEGFHSRSDEPLMMIVNEAKSVDSAIFEGIDRCTPDVLMLISSPGLREGRFYDCFTKLAPVYRTIRAGLADCPHITKEKIDSVVATYGADHPFTRSTLYGEFMSQADGEQYCGTIEELESCLEFPPKWRPGFKYGFFDFADGRAENVLVVRHGNRYEIADAWRDTNQDAVVGRAIYLLRKFGIKNDGWGADAAAKEILDKMSYSGFTGHRRNFGAQDKNGIYKSWSALAWLEGWKKIREREVILPDDAVLKSQITARKKLFTPSGKLAVEDKTVMQRDRGLESPDRGDALFGCMAARDTTLDVPRSLGFDFEEDPKNLGAETELLRRAGL